MVLNKYFDEHCDEIVKKVREMKYTIQFIFSHIYPTVYYNQNNTINIQNAPKANLSLLEKKRMLLAEQIGQEAQRNFKAISRVDNIAKFREPLEKDVLPSYIQETQSWPLYLK